MKKLLVSIAAGVLSLAATAVAWAAPHFYMNPNYSMNNLRAVKIVSVEDNSVVRGNNYSLVPEAAEQVVGGIYEACDKLKLQVADVRVSEQPTPGNTSRTIPATIDLRITIGQMGVYQDLVPGYWSEETKQEDVDVWDKEKRKWVKTRIARKVKVWVPERWRDNCEINLNYDVIDPTDGTVIAKCSDSRSRSEENDVHGMVKRSTRDFLKNMLKKK